MPKRTIALITVITLITLLLVTAAFIQLKKDTPITGEPQRTSQPQISKTIEKRASLSFSPQVASTSSIPSRVDILADTGGLAITGVQVELEYDPTKISNVSLIPVTVNNLFGDKGQVLIQELRPSAGRISYAVVISPDANEVKGVGPIIGLSFTAAPGATGETQIKFLDKSLVTMLGSTESVLKGTVPLSITFTNTIVPSQGVPINPQEPAIIISPTQTPTQ
jgi:hypothetical protein